MSKLVNDALVIAWLNTLRFTRPPIAFIASMVLFPLPMLFLAR